MIKPPIIVRGIRGSVLTEMQLCWAACIEMVAQKYSSGQVPVRFQEKLKIFKNSLSPNNSTQTMPSGKDFYAQIFKKDPFLSPIGATQYQNPDFWADSFFKNKLNNNQAIILSGFRFPLVNSLHAILITGYFEDRNATWLLGLNPNEVGKPAAKTAWLHHYLKWKNRETNTIDAVTNFNDPQSPDVRQRTSLFTAVGNILDSLTLNKYFSEKNQLQFTEHTDDQQYIANVLNIYMPLLKDYFGLGGSFNSFNKIKIRNLEIEVKKSTKLAGLFSNIHKNELLILNVYQRQTNLIDLYFVEVGRATYLVGIAEPIGNTNISLLVDVQNISGVSNFNLDHRLPNYNLVNIGPLNYMCFEVLINAKLFYAPIKDYEGVVGGQIYTLEKINEIQDYLNI